MLINNKILPTKLIVYLKKNTQQSLLYVVRNVSTLLIFRSEHAFGIAQLKINKCN